MEVNFTGEVITIAKGTQENSLAITFQLESGTGITIQVLKADESSFKVGSTYNFVGNPA